MIEQGLVSAIIELLCDCLEVFKIANSVLAHGRYKEPAGRAARWDEVLRVGHNIDIQIVRCRVSVNEFRFNRQAWFGDQAEERVAVAWVTDEQRFVGA